MKRLCDMLVVGLIIAAIAGTVCFFVGVGEKPLYSECNRDVEFIFFVVDSRTGEPISGAMINAETEWPETNEKFKLVTNENGRARIRRDQERGVDIERPFRKTITRVNRPWCVFSVEAKGV